MTNIFDKNGGVPVVTIIVRDFYMRVLKRHNLRRYFESVSMVDLIKHQIEFVALAMAKNT
jgi:truncated hemoglobin YjbI